MTCMTIKKCYRIQHIMYTLAASYLLTSHTLALLTSLTQNLNTIIGNSRMASKANGNIDDPGAFPAREWLRNLCVGKQVAFETR